MLQKHLYVFDIDKVRYHHFINSLKTFSFLLPNLCSFFLLVYEFCIVIHHIPFNYYQLRQLLQIFFYFFWLILHFPDLLPLVFLMTMMMMMIKMMMMKIIPILNLSIIMIHFILSHLFVIILNVIPMTLTQNITPILILFLVLMISIHVMTIIIAITFLSIIIFSSLLINVNYFIIYFYFKICDH
jgi:hypothetical protein